MTTAPAAPAPGRWIPVGLTVLAVAWAVVRVAPGIVPDAALAAERAGQWPRADLPEYSQFVRNSPLGQIAYQVIGSPGVWGYLLLHALAVVAALTLTAIWLARVAPQGSSLLATRLTVLSPLAAVLVVFVGAYDPFTVLGMLLLLYSWTIGPRWMAVVAGVYLGFQHFEQGLASIVVGGLVAVAVGLADPDLVRRGHIGWAIPGLLLGKLVLVGTLALTIGDGLSGRGSFLVWAWIRPAVVSQVNFGPVILLSLFSGAWAIVALTVLRAQPHARLLLAVAFAIALVPTTIAADHTRIFILVSFVGLALLTAWFLRDPSFGVRDRHLVEWMAWVITPLFIWTAGEGFVYVQHTGVIDVFIMLGQMASAW